MSALVAIDCRKIADFGIGTYIRGLLHGLAVLPGPEEYLLLLPEELGELAPREARFRRVDEKAGKYSLRELLEVGRHADRQGATLFHAPHYVVPSTRARVVVTIHDLIHLNQPMANPLARLYARGMIRRAVRRADRIITLTDAVRREIEERYPAAAGRVQAVANGVDEHFRAVAGPGPGEPGAEAGRYFLFVGNPKPHKNLGRLVEAFGVVRARHPELALVLAGAPSVRSEPERGIFSAGVVSESRLASLYRGAVALVQPSMEEGFGLPVAEAMAAGTAVIVSSVPALIEVAGDAAWRVDPFSAASMTAAMSELYENAALRSRLMAKSRERGLQFSWSRCAEATLELYRAVMRSPFPR